MTDLRDAAKLALGVLETVADEVVSPYNDPIGEAILALRRALAEDTIDILVEREELRAVVVEKLSAVVTSFLKDRKRTTCPNCASLMEQNTELDKKLSEWVGLTDEEIWSVVSRIGTANSDVNPYQTILDARAIEAKLKEKNR